MGVQFAGSAVFVVVFLESRQGDSDPCVLHPKGRDGVRDHPFVQLRSDDLGHPVVDELIERVDVLLGEPLEAVEGTYKFVFGRLMGKRVDLTELLLRVLVQFVHHLSFISLCNRSKYQPSKKH